MDLKREIVNLYRKAATEIPLDIIIALERAYEKENDQVPKEVLANILKNIVIAKTEVKPVCQDTGTPILYVNYRKDQSQEELRKIIDEATKTATEEIPLRPNAVDALTERNTGNKPIMHFEESGEFRIDLMLRGGGSENVSAVYQLPNREINAERNIDGIRKCVIDSVFRAQGKGCPPYIIGVAIGGDIEQAAHLSKKQLLRKIDDLNPSQELKGFESKVLDEVNRLGIGPLGLGGNTTALGVKSAVAERHPASFFVGISIGCWCLRRQNL